MQVLNYLLNRAIITKAAQNQPTQEKALALAASTRWFCSNLLSEMHCLVRNMTRQQSLLSSAISTVLILTTSKASYILTTSTSSLLISACVLSPLLIMQLILLWLYRQFLISLHLVDWIRAKACSQLRCAHSYYPRRANSSPYPALHRIYCISYLSSRSPVLKGSAVIEFTYTSIIRFEFTGMPGCDYEPQARDASMQNLPLKPSLQSARQNSKPGISFFLPKRYVARSCLTLVMLSRQRNCLARKNSPTRGLGPTPGSTTTILSLCGTSSTQMPKSSSFCQKIGRRGYGLKYYSASRLFFISLQQ